MRIDFRAAPAEPELPDDEEVMVAALPLFRPLPSGDAELGQALAFRKPPPSTLLLLFLAGLAFVFLFGLLVSFDQVATARGIVMPASGVARLKASQPGIVAAVLVKQGQAVRRGAPLLRIASADFLPNGAAAPERVLETFRRQQEVAALGEEAEKQRRVEAQRQLDAQIGELSAALGSVRMQAALEQQRIDAGEQRLRSLDPLVKKGYVSTFRYQDQQQEVLGLRQELAGLRQREADARNQLADARLRLGELRADATKSALQSAASRLELERGAATAQVQAEVTLTAAINGRVAALRAVPGMSVDAQQELGTIVRAGDAMEAWLFVPLSDAGSIRPGQAVDLRYDAFPALQHGIGHGVTTEVATTAYAEQPNAAPTYRVRVRLLDPGRFALRPDMSLSATIRTRRQSLLDWLLAPLRRAWGAAGDDRP